MSTIIVIAVLVIVLLWGVSAYNGLVRQRNQAEESFSTMDVYLKKRFDQIPNVVAAVKGYAKHEAETLENIVKLRNGAQSIDDKLAVESQINKAIQSLMVQVEAYPQLKANENFLDLQHQLLAVEEDIANARKYYNGCVRELNNSIQMVPTNIIANLFGFKTMRMYEVEDRKQRENVNVSF